MSRVGLVVALILSLWPVGAIAASIANNTTGSGSASTSDSSGGTTVNAVEPATGTIKKVRLSGPGGKTYYCPVRLTNRLDTLDRKAAQLKLKLQGLRKNERKFAKQHPGKTLPAGPYRRWKALHRDDDRFVAAFNRAVDKHNATLRRECT
jgi:hypothetical protein